MKTSTKSFAISLSLVAFFVMTAAVAMFAATDPIPGVDVHLKSADGHTRVVKTDADGRFVFSQLPEGACTISVSYDQCARAINTKGTGAVVREASSTTHQFAIDCDDHDGITVAAGDVNGDGAMDRVTAPRDVATGQASGKRMHKPFVITKEWTASSPGLRVAVSGKSKELTGHVTLIK